MKKTFITTILLVFGVLCILIGINTHNIILSIVGGFGLGVYNGIINNKTE